MFLNKLGRLVYNVPQLTSKLTRAHIIEYSSIFPTSLLFFRSSSSSTEMHFLNFPGFLKSGSNQAKRTLELAERSESRGENQ